MKIKQITSQQARRLMVDDWLQTKNGKRIQVSRIGARISCTDGVDYMHSQLYPLPLGVEDLETAIVVLKVDKSVHLTYRPLPGKSIQVIIDWCCDDGRSAYLDKPCKYYHELQHLVAEVSLVGLNYEKRFQVEDEEEPKQEGPSNDGEPDSTIDAEG